MATYIKTEEQKQRARKCGLRHYYAKKNDPVELERRRATTRAWHQKHKDDPAYIEQKRAYFAALDRTEYQRNYQRKYRQAQKEKNTKNLLADILARHENAWHFSKWVYNSYYYETKKTL